MTRVGRLGLLLGWAVAVKAVGAAPIDDFVKAAELNDERSIKAMLAKGLDPNQPDDRGRLALFIAAREESERAVAALVTAPQLEVDKANANGETALMIAAIRGSLASVQALVARGASVNREGWTPLHYAASGPDNGVSAYLIGRGADLNARSPNGTTPLMMAARYGNSLVVPLLLKAGADPSLLNEKGLSAVDFARSGGRETVAREIDAALAQKTGASAK